MVQPGPRPDIADHETAYQGFSAGDVGEMEAFVRCPDRFVAFAFALCDLVSPALAVAFVVLVWVFLHEVCFFRASFLPFIHILF